MFKQISTVFICFILAVALAGCWTGESMSGGESIRPHQLPDNTDAFNQRYKDIIRIDVNFDLDNESSTIHIKDGKIISDILAMVYQSKSITDTSDLASMRDMTKRNNKLVLYDKDGGTKEITFAYDDLYLLGYLDVGGKKYNPGYDFFRYIHAFPEYSQYDTNIVRDVTDLFGKYGWTVDYRINSIKETLPTDFMYKAGEFPVKLYWAYNNELSKNVGLDYSSYLGQSVDADIYRLREPLPEYMKPRIDARGVVLKQNGKIIGAFIDAGRHSGFACSLNRKSLEEITGKNWDEWIDGNIDYTDELEIKLSKMSPEEIIKKYFDAMNNHDEKMQFACRTLSSVCGYLSINMDNNLLYNVNFGNAYLGEDTNLNSAKLLGLRKNEGIPKPDGIIEYEATVDFNFKEVITSENGVQTRFVLFKKETEKSGWRIESVGTGP